MLPQIFYEFWVVATRAIDQNGLGMNAADDESEIRRRRFFIHISSAVNSSSEAMFDENYAKNNAHYLQDIETFIERSQQWMHWVTENTPANKNLRKLVSRNFGVRGNLRRKFQRLKNNLLQRTKYMMRAA